MLVARGRDILNRKRRECPPRTCGRVRLPVTHSEKYCRRLMSHAMLAHGPPKLRD